MAGRGSAKRTGPTIKVTWARSTIGHTAAARGTIRALGLRRLGQTGAVGDSRESRGMRRRVAFLPDGAAPTGRGSSEGETK